MSMSRRTRSPSTRAAFPRTCSSHGQAPPPRGPPHAVASWLRDLLAGPSSRILELSAPAKVPLHASDQPPQHLAHLGPEMPEALPGKLPVLQARSLGPIEGRPEYFRACTRAFPRPFACSPPALRAALVPRLRPDLAPGKEPLIIDLTPRLPPRLTCSALEVVRTQGPVAGCPFRAQLADIHSAGDRRGVVGLQGGYG